VPAAVGTSATVVFIDTSVMCDLLAIPGKYDPQRADQARAVLRRPSGVRFVVALPALVETGNHIAQVRDGSHRRRLAGLLRDMMIASADGAAPWTVPGGDRGRDWVRRLAEGVGVESMADLASRRIGLGDVALAHELLHYREVTYGVDVRIWTYDEGLASILPTFDPSRTGRVRPRRK